MDFEHVVRMYNGNFTRISNWDDLSSVMKNSLDAKGLNVYEMVTKRDTNLVEHRKFWSEVSQEISNFVNGNKK